jgi:hypothetical protein
MLYTYKSDVGVFAISPDPQQTGRWRLYIGDLWLGSYKTPWLAADDVYMCQTGYDDWDKKITVRHPEDLGEWQAVKRRP